MGVLTLPVAGVEGEQKVVGSDGELWEGPWVDEWLTRYVRSTVGRLLSRPGSIDVEAYEGRVTLRGLVKAREILGVVAAVAALPEVRGVVNLLVTEPAA